MSKRFTDTEKYKKPFYRSLPGPYKLLWDYLYHDCNHAGIWQKDFQIAQIYVGTDMPITEAEAIRLFNRDEERVRPLDGGAKWLIVPFVEFQYGTLNPANRLHASVLAILAKAPSKDLASPFQGAKDKEKDKVLKKGSVRGNKSVDPFFDLFWSAYPKKKAKVDALRAWQRLAPDSDLRETILRALQVQSRVEDWTKENGKYVPLPASWLNGRRWEDDVKAPFGRPEPTPQQKAEAESRYQALLERERKKVEAKMEASKK